MKKISKEIFTPYLYEEGSIRPALEKPFPCNGWVCATDNKVLLLICEDLLEEKFEPVKNSPDITKVIPVRNCELLLTRDVLANALNSLPMKEVMKEVYPEIPCKECEGDGEVEWEYEDRNFHRYSRWFECPCCNGSRVFRKAVFEPTGKMEPDSYSLVILNGVGIWANNLQTLLGTMDFLGISEVTIRSLNDRNACLIRITEGIEFIFMPVNDFRMAIATHHLTLMPQL